MRALNHRHTAVLGLLGLMGASGLVLSSSASAAFSTLRLLPGSTSHVDTAGNSWKPDTTCTGGSVSVLSVNIAGTTDDFLYQHQREGVTSCRLPVAGAATYRVTLLLSENATLTSRKRVFDIQAGGVTRVASLDIAALAGVRTATKVSFDVPTTGNTLDLRFVARKGKTKVSAIMVALVTPTSPTPSSAPTTSPPSPTSAPAPSTSASPTTSPIVAPTLSPTVAPTLSPTVAPTLSPTASPTATPTATPTFTLDPSFDRPSKSDPADYRMHVDFNVVCKVASVLSDDPIVFPGQPGRSHLHVMAGNLSTSAMSTQESLDAASSNCLLSRDTAAYWMPQLFDETGTALLPKTIRAYYRAGTLNRVAYIPHGLRVIAGDSKATTAQSKSIAGWQCRTVSPDTVAIGKQALLPTCASTDQLEGSVVFPNCWDGKNLDSADHKSHMAYGNGDLCDAAHPVRLPQLTLAYRYAPGTTNSQSYLSSETSSLTLHADFWNAWHQPTLDALVDRCINAGVHCGDVSPSHFPGPIPS